MRTPIPEDATELVYHPNYGRAPIIVKVVKHTPTTVQVSGFSQKFRRKDGVMQQGVGSIGQNGYVSPITPEDLDHIEAAKLYPQVTELTTKIQAAAQRKVSELIQAATKGNMERKTVDCQAAIDALTALLESFQTPKDG